MTSPTSAAMLPLQWTTPASWALGVLAQSQALLSDHAYLERKAASNALMLLNRWPESDPPENWVVAMTAIARDEVEHLASVTQLLHRRGGRLARAHQNPYAAGLHDQVRLGEGPREIVDRLLVSALIEARSCERFCLLAEATHPDAARPDDELHQLYAELWGSEAGHYRVFLGLARQLKPEREVEARWEAMLAIEAELIRSQPVGPTMHSGTA